MDTVTEDQEVRYQPDYRGTGSEVIGQQGKGYRLFYLIFGLTGGILMWYYLSYTLFHFTTGRQFAIDSFTRFPLTYLIFPAEVFSFLFSLYFVYNLLPARKRPAPSILENREFTRVAILLPIYNEPRHIVERLLAASSQVNWPGGVRIYLLDDSTSEEERRCAKDLSSRYNAILVRRSDRIGYKAGNINHAIKEAVSEDFFLILDSDQAPAPDFLESTMDYFSDPKIGFVQTPQYFINDDTPLSRAAKIGTNIFYQAQCESKAGDGAMPFCGTNVVVRKAAFLRVNGFSYYSATEDIDLGLRMNEAGYFGAYVPKILAYGYAPADFGAYTSQQYRWANGNLAIFRESWHKVLFGNYSLRYQTHTFFTLGWWLIGVVTFVYILVPLLSLIFHTGTHHTWLPNSLLVLLYFNVVLGILMIYVSLQGRLKSDKVSLKDAFLQYVLITNSMFIYMRAALSAFVGRYVGFVRTNKLVSRTGIRNIWPNLLLSFICYCASMYSLFYAITSTTPEQIRTYLPISVWMLFYSLILASSILLVGDSRPKKVEVQ